MPYAAIEKEIERLDETQQNTVVLFVRFLLSQKAAAPLRLLAGGGTSETARGSSGFSRTCS